MKEWLKAVIILPFNVLVVIPVFILYFCDYKYVYNSLLLIILGIIFVVVGFILAVTTMLLFNNIGKGTAAPWSPPKVLVVEGPYKFVRNPMITAVLAILSGESMILNSPEIFCWFVVFFLINSIYFPLFEERQLKNRFGQEYLEYMNRVPRWIPKFDFWKK